MNVFTQSFAKLGGSLLLGVLLTATVLCADVPGFVKEPIHSPNAAVVAKVVPSLSADVVILDGGREQGLRLGMVCSVSRGFKQVGELIIIESRSNRSAGLILELAEDAFIQSGDIARIKTLQNS
ncbi:hypothetical protein [Coraliomargarita parva]|uniref:hypothetical protein n=1 Tax=Coraliomargarita parva TaxID=3014050 RepID=UPI0022B47EFB|nr:hypothetical protein [Coraliomargarita parva]